MQNLRGAERSPLDMQLEKRLADHAALVKPSLGHSELLTRQWRQHVYS